MSILSVYLHICFNELTRNPNNVTSEPFISFSCLDLSSKLSLESAVMTGNLCCVVLQVLFEGMWGSSRGNGHMALDDITFYTGDCSSEYPYVNQSIINQLISQ